MYKDMKRWTEIRLRVLKGEASKHEIAHAVSDGKHGKPWFSRMGKAALKSHSLGRKDLVKLLEEEFENYKGGIKVTDMDVYDDIEPK